MNKKTLVLATALLAATATAQASETVTLEVTGQVTPSACSIDLSNQNLAYADIDARNLKQDNPTFLGTTLRTNLTVSCSIPTKIGFSVTDDHADSVHTEAAAHVAQGHGAELGFGLGNKSGDAIGAYVVGFSIAAVEGKDSEIISSKEDSDTWISAQKRLTPDSSMLYAWKRAGSGTHPANVENAVAQLTVNAAVAPASQLDLSSSIELEGKATFTLLYL